MFTAEVQFSIPGSVDVAEDLIFNLLSSWRSNGQVLGSEWSFSQKGNIYRTTVMIYDEHALAVKNDDQYARKSRRALAKINKGALKINVIGEETGIATYYYLLRSTGRSLTSEIKRKCPSCGGDWLLDEPLHDRFDFKCDRCRLLSNIAFSVR